MEIQLTITLSDRLFTLLDDKLPNLGRRVEKAITKEISAQARKESKISVAVNSVVEKAGTSEAAENLETKAPQPVAEIPTDPQKMAETIREIMHLTRQRFEGEDYKDNTASDLYKKYHRQLTSQFKQIAMILGFDKPSSINTPDKVAAFKEECDALIIGDDGNITPPPSTLLNS